MNPYVVVWFLNSLAGIALGAVWVADALRAARHNPPGPQRAARHLLDRGWLAVSAGFTAMELLNLIVGLAVVAGGTLPPGVLAWLFPLGLTLGQDLVIAGVAAMRYFRERAFRALPPDPPAG